MVVCETTTWRGSSTRLCLGLSHFADDPARFLEGAEAMGFSSFMGGLLAKSVLDLIKNLFKKVFRG